MQVFKLRANANSTFVWTRDFSAWASEFDLPNCVIRMQMRQGPFLDVLYEWSTTNGKAVYSAGNVTFYAPVADVLNFSDKKQFDIRIERADGAPVVVALGVIDWMRGITRITADSTETDVAGLPDTVSTDGETPLAPLVVQPDAPIMIHAFTSSGIYVPTTGMKYCDSFAFGGGGGAGAGARAASGSACSGGGAGGAGGFDHKRLTAAQIGASKAVTIGAKGVGGAAQTVDSTAGANGSAGGSTSLGSLLHAGGGGAGSGGQIGAGSGGGGGGGPPSSGASASGATGGAVRSALATVDQQALGPATRPSKASDRGVAVATRPELRQAQAEQRMFAARQGAALGAESPRRMRQPAALRAESYMSAARL